MRLRSVAVSLAAVAAAVLLALGGVSPAEPARADVNDFVIDSFDAEYELGRDDDGRSTLRTVERIVAVFPEFDQNRGIIRDIPRLYDGHETDLTVRSVTDEHGAPRSFETEEYGDFLAVTIAVPRGSYVHGTQTYVIEYAQRDVTRFFEDTGADEFYWDVNGTGWAQPFGRVSARIALAEELVPALNGDAACYRGGFGSGDPCDLAVAGGAVSAEEQNLGPFENVTLAIGFERGTFSARPAPFFERFPLFLYGGIAGLVAAIGLTVAGLWRGVRGARSGRAIIAQYEPPEGTSVAVSAEIVRAKRKAMTATLLDLAVRRKIRLLRDEAADRYGAQLIDGEGLLLIEAKACAKIFGGGARAESVRVAESDRQVWFDRKSTRLGDAARALTQQAREEALASGLTRKPGKGLMIGIPLLFVLALVLLAVHAILIDNFILMTVLLAVGANVLIWLLFGVIAALGTRRPLTAEGALLHDHLMGLREYIRLAEADRIRMLQSASGAEVDEQFIVRVYEQLLPYAVLFGYEREWQTELARYYRESTPDWVSGSGRGFSDTLSIVALSSAIASSPVTRTASSFGSGSGSSFSSSSGGSSGGGFSGGGGGGGGGRGI